MLSEFSILATRRDVLGIFNYCVSDLPVFIPHNALGIFHDAEVKIIF